MQETQDNVKMGNEESFGITSPDVYNLNINENKGEISSLQGNLHPRKNGTIHIGSLSLVLLNLPQSQQVQKDSDLRSAI